MSGIQEILLLVIIVLAIFFIPRMLAKPEPKQQAKPAVELTGKLRLAIAASTVWPALMAAYLQPWHKDLVLFLYLGFGPVVLGWGAFWIITGFRRKR